MIQHGGKHTLNRTRRNEYQYGPVGGPIAAIETRARGPSAHVKLFKHRTVFSGKTMEEALTLALKWLDVEIDRINSSKPGAGP
jgi:hypothetical protein